MTVEVTPNGKLMVITVGLRTIYLDRDEAMKLYELIRAKLGEFSVKQQLSGATL